MRGAWQRPPYFHDGSAATLADVVAHYDTYLELGLTAAEQADLIEFPKSLQGRAFAGAPARGSRGSFQPPHRA